MICIRCLPTAFLGSATSKQYACCCPRPIRPRNWWSWANPNRSASWITIKVALGTSTPTSITVVETNPAYFPALKSAIIWSFSAPSILPCKIPIAYLCPKKSFSSSYNVMAFCKSMTSDSSISGATTKACRPFLNSCSINASTLSHSPFFNHLVTTGLRPAGSWSIIDTSISP